MVRKGDKMKNARTGQIMIFLQSANDTNGELLDIECFNPQSNAKEPEHIHPFQNIDSFKRLGWTGKSFGILSIHNWPITKVINQTQVTVDESMEGLPASLLKKAFNKNLDKSLQTWLELLKKECE
jgi:hypothetical protein